MKNKFKYDNFFYKFIKRFFDIIISLVGCLLLIPIIIIVKICYIASGDFNKIIFIQNRIGLNGKEFKFYKFRTMIPDADKVLYELLKENKDIRNEYKRNKKIKNDPRITKIGDILRKCSIDEFPQFFNILKGDMTFVGNRPYLPREKKDMGKFYNEIIKTKPGLTGIWQTSGRNDISFKRRLKLEKYYSNNCNIFMDIEIFFKTFKVVFKINGSK